MTALLACWGVAQAQDAGRDHAVEGAWRGTGARSAGFAPAPAFSFVQITPAGPYQRPRAALRMRFDSATRAIRGLGVEAEDCTSLLRSSTSRGRSTDPGGEGLRVNVTLAVSCRFF